MVHFLILVCMNVPGVPCQIGTDPRQMTEAACQTQMPARLEIMRMTLVDHGYGDNILSIEGFCRPAQGVAT